MKIIEAMKELRLIEKKIATNCTRITQYASAVSTEKLPFGSEEDQRSEVKSLVQANADLFARYLELKQRIEQTNLITRVKLAGKEWSISQLLVIRRKLGQPMLATYNSLNDREARSRMRSAVSGVEGKGVHVIQLYDEREKNERLNYWQDFLESIDARLEVVNATTELSD